MTGVDKVLDQLGLHRRRRERGQPRHDGRHQQAARGQGREPRVHHHRGLRVHPRDRPAVGARTATATPTSGSSPTGSCRPTGSGPSAAGSPSTARRSGRSTRSGAVAAARFFRDAGIDTHRRLLPALLRQRRATSVAMRDVLAREHPEAMVSISQRGAARVPRVRAGRHHPRRRGREAQHPRYVANIAGAAAPSPTRRRPATSRST